MAQSPAMDCPLCATPTDAFAQNAQRAYRLCPLCRLISVPPEHLPGREEEELRYREHENSLDNPGYVAMFLDKVRHLQEHCPEAETALDYGCGYEPVLATLLEREGYHAEKYDSIFFPQLPEGARFDLVISTETFEHFHRPARELQTIRRLLRPAGFLAVMTRFYTEAGETPNAAAFLNWYYQRDPTHVCFYRLATFDWIARAHGFQHVFDNGKDFILLQRVGGAAA
ncbi:class I SAM-dependent methyltransferase [Nitrospina watsonii]|nr:class I SAM-dependent methyltransferase [Nitrospina watsonii]